MQNLWTKLLALVIVFVSLSACLAETKPTIEPRNIFYAGGDNGVKTALLEAGYTLVDDFETAEVFVLNGKIPEVDAIAARLQHGAGLLLIVGEEMSFRDVEILLDYPVSALIPGEDPRRLAFDEDFGENDPLRTEINWDEAPIIGQRFAIFTPAPGKPLVRYVGYAEPFLAEIGNPPERKYTLDAVLDEQYNLPLQEWEYFNYLIYHLVERAAGAEPMTFADYSTLDLEP